MPAAILLVTNAFWAPLLALYASLAATSCIVLTIVLEASTRRWWLPALGLAAAGGAFTAFFPYLVRAILGPGS